MSTAKGPRSINRRQVLIAAALAVPAGFAAACTVGGKSETGSTNSAPATAAASVTVNPADKASDVTPRSPVTATVAGGTFTQVSLTNSASGKAVAGNLSADKKTYTVTEPLGFNTSYEWSGSASGSDGKTVTVSGSFTTLAPSVKTSVNTQIADGQSVGIAAPLMLQFDGPVKNKAAVEKALSITVTPATEGAWGWVPDEGGGSRVHWRPKEYFAPGTTISLNAPLYGLDYGDGAYGAADLTLNYKIGRSQIVKADATSHRIQVIRDGAVVMDFPCSYGEGNENRNVTRSGIHVVTEFYEDIHMSNPPYYTDAHERWAVRISNNGEFIHANPLTLGDQGATNVTNGCINLSTENAEQYFKAAIYGDPVEVTNTRIDLSAADGDIWDWTLSWSQWQTLSAITGEGASTTTSAVPATPSGAPSPQPTR